MLEVLLGQIPEAIYFSLFMIFAKGLKEKRILFTILMIIEYLLLKQFIKFNVLFQILYTFMSYIILKILYKEKSQIIDIFTFTIGSIILMISSIICFMLSNKNPIIASIINRLFLFIFIISLNHKISKIQEIYKTLWNRNDFIKKKIKSTTFRCINLIIFNLSFYILNIIMLYCIFLKK